jgi:hypothetical protein
MSGDTNFEFFDDKGELFRIVDVKNATKTIRDIQNITVIKQWLETWFREHQIENTGFTWKEVPRRDSPIRGNCYYDATDGDTKRLQIIPAARGNDTAEVSIFKTGTIKYFKNEEKLRQHLDEMLNRSKPI